MQNKNTSKTMGANVLSFNGPISEIKMMWTGSHTGIRESENTGTFLFLPNKIVTNQPMNIIRITDPKSVDEINDILVKLTGNPVLTYSTKINMLILCSAPSDTNGEPAT